MWKLLVLLVLLSACVREKKGAPKLGLNLLQPDPPIVHQVQPALTFMILYVVKHPGWYEWSSDTITISGSMDYCKQYEIPETLFTYCLVTYGTEQTIPIYIEKKYKL